MRLLNVQTSRLEEYFPPNVPPYAILSHCWGNEEVTFQHIFGQELHAAKDLLGYIKINLAIDQCKLDALSYLWADTCCIDKSSSAELSEAINSMYSWYRGSTVCYAYLEDVTTAGSTIKDEGSDFQKSRWFTRGWTLQELIAPVKVLFFGRNWAKLGDKVELAGLISATTKIHKNVVLDASNVPIASVARRMSWAACRETTRVEDLAYSLLGIFGVNMPLLYGEGDKAFIRLQEELIKESDDQSLFAWEWDAEVDAGPPPVGILASSPRLFQASADIVPIPQTVGIQPYSMTNRGLRIEIRVFSTPHSRHAVAFFDCCRGTDVSNPFAIPLQRTSIPDVYKRHHPQYLYRWKEWVKLMGEESKMRIIYLLKTPPYTEWGDYDICVFLCNKLQAHGYQISEVAPRGVVWKPGSQTVIRRMGLSCMDDFFIQDSWIAIEFSDSDESSLLVLLVLMDDIRVLVLPGYENGSSNSKSQKVRTIKQFLSVDKDISKIKNFSSRFDLLVNAEDGTTSPSLEAKVAKESVVTENKLNQLIYVVEIQEQEEEQDNGQFLGTFRRLWAGIGK